MGRRNAVNFLISRCTQATVPRTQAHLFPCFEVLDTVEEHAIVAGGGGGDAKDEGVPVELPQAGLLPPVDMFKLRSLLLGNNCCLLVGRISLEDTHADGSETRGNGFDEDLKDLVGQNFRAATAWCAQCRMAK